MQCTMTHLRFKHCEFVRLVCSKRTWESSLAVAVQPPSKSASSPLAHGSLLGLLRPVFTPRIRPVTHTAQIQCASHQLVPHTGTILRPPTPDQHHAVLLDVVPLTGNVCGDGLAGRQAHTCRLAFARVWFLGPRDADFDAYAFSLRVLASCQGRGDGVARAAGFATALGERDVSL